MMTINCNGTLVDLSKPKVMGIINATPDSFYDGTKPKDNNTALKKVEKMLMDGVTFIDIGGVSTRPNATMVTEDVELKRVVELVQLIKNNFPTVLISIDTFRAKVANECVSAGACMINDISAGSLDKRMFETVGRLQVPYVLMHMKGTPKTMQQEPSYTNLMQEINLFFSEKICLLKSFGLNDIILDVGFGFGKTIDHNYQLLKNIQIIGFNDFPLLVGLSRKSMVYKPLNVTPDDALNGTSVLNMIALQNGAKILRVHDVKEAVEIVKLYEMLCCENI